MTDITSIFTILCIMKRNNLYKVYCELHILLKLYLTIPLSNATAAEIISSAQRRVKAYLRNHFTQEHLNHYLILQSHNIFTDDIDQETFMNSFINVNERGCGILGNKVRCKWVY